tara:strand:- start:231 stop:467 length:237 start_codon:yes stop_codon:yes gene_type:complete
MDHRVKYLTKIRNFNNIIYKSKKEKQWVKIKSNQLKVDEILYSDKKFLNLAVFNYEIKNTINLCDQYEEASVYLSLKI